MPKSKAACPFCAIEKDAPSIVAFRNAHALVVLDKHPLVEGHLLVLPKRHAESIGDLNPKEQAALLAAAVKGQTVLMKNGLAQGVDWRVNYRPFLPEGEYALRHVHVHLLPRSKDDALFRAVYKNQRFLRTHPTVRQLAETGGKFRKAFAALKG